MSIFIGLCEYVRHPLFTVLKFQLAQFRSAIQIKATTNFFLSFIPMAIKNGSFEKKGNNLSPCHREQLAKTIMSKVRLLKEFSICFTSEFGHTCFSVSLYFQCLIIN